MLGTNKQKSNPRLGHRFNVYTRVVAEKLLYDRKKEKQNARKERNIYVVGH